MTLHFVILLISVICSPRARALECNICGPGTNNIIGNPRGILTLNYGGVAREQSCHKWQQGRLLDEEWCRVNIMNYSVRPCACLLPDGEVLMDVLAKDMVTTCPHRQNSDQCHKLMTERLPPNNYFDCYNFCGGIFISSCNSDGCGALSCTNATENGLNSLVLGCTDEDRRNGGRSAKISGTLRDLIESRPELSLSRDALQSSGVIDMLDDLTQTFTVFAPSDSGVRGSRLMQFEDRIDVSAWSYHLKALVLNHIVPSQGLLIEDIFQMANVETFQSVLAVSPITETVGGASIEVSDLAASNGVLHIISSTLEQELFDHPFADLELQSEFGPDWLNRTSMIDIVDFVGARDVLRQLNGEGTTYAGCRIRAFNRMGIDYLPQTINGAQSVLFGELLNASMKEHTLENFIEYQLIPKNLYLDSIPNGFQELVTPAAECGHMWVTKSNGKLCFNDACVVSTPYPRTYLSSNGVGYVVDKCPICPGIAMLANYAAEYTSHNLRYVSQFLVGSGWNLRNLSLSIGDGTPITLFAPINTGWDSFTLEDTTRLATDKWKRHLWDLLRHLLLQGEYSKEALKQMVLNNGGKPLNLTMMTGEKVVLDYDGTRNVVKVGHGDIYFSDVRGVDGFVHFVTEVTLPRSVSHNVYDLGRESDEFKIHMTYIDSIFMAEDLKRLLPLTVFYAPNEAFEGKIFEITEVSESLLENMVFGELLWCEGLVSMAGEQVTSHNGQTWIISVNEVGFPCFDTAEINGGATKKACITHCDILARNGIVHKLDDILVKTTPLPSAPPSLAGSGTTAPIQTVPPTLSMSTTAPTSVGETAQETTAPTGVPSAAELPTNTALPTEAAGTTPPLSDERTSGPATHEEMAAPTAGSTPPPSMGGFGTAQPSLSTTTTAPTSGGTTQATVAIQTVPPTLSMSTTAPISVGESAQETTVPTSVPRAAELPTNTALPTQAAGTTPPSTDERTSGPATPEETVAPTAGRTPPPSIGGFGTAQPSLSTTTTAPTSGGATHATAAPTLAPSATDSTSNVLPTPVDKTTSPSLAETTAVPTELRSTTAPGVVSTAVPSSEGPETSINATDPFLNVTTIAPNATSPTDDNRFFNSTTPAPSQGNSPENIFNRDPTESPLAANTTDPYLNATTIAPSGNSSLLGETISNTSTLAPSPDSTSGNSYHAPTQDEAPFLQNASVVLEGLSHLLNVAEQENYVLTTQAFLRKQDPTIVVEFAGQKLIEGLSPRHLDNLRRFLQEQNSSTALEVTTLIVSWEDESPGTSAASFIQGDKTGYVESLRQSSDSFVELQNVEAAGPPGSNPAKSNGKQSSPKLWYGVGLLVLSLVCAIFISVKYVRLARQRPGRCSDENSSAKQLNDEDAMNNISVEDDTRHRFDQNSWHNQDVGRYRYDQDAGGQGLWRSLAPLEQDENSFPLHRQERVTVGDSSEGSGSSESSDSSEFRQLREF